MGSEFLLEVDKSLEILEHLSSGSGWDIVMFILLTLLGSRLFLPVNNLV